MVYITNNVTSPEIINGGDSIIKTVCCTENFETLIFRQIQINGFPMVKYRCLACGKITKLKLT